MYFFPFERYRTVSILSLAAGICVVAGFLADAHAAVRFVSPTGDDAVDAGSNDINHPWKTPGKAFTSTAAGDTVYFRAGTYAITTPVNVDGGSVMPVLLTRYGDESVYITGTTAGPLFDIQRQSYTVDGINFTGPGTCFRVGWDRNGSGFTVRNCTYDMTTGGDNVGFVYANGTMANNTCIENCSITGPGAGAHANSSGVIAFSTQRLKVINCEISNLPIGIYYKHANDTDAVSYDTDIEIARNYFHETSRYGMEINANHARIHDNLFGLNNAAIRFNECNGSAGGDYNIFAHNTLYETGIELSGETYGSDHSYPGAVGNTIRDNVFYGVSDGEYKIFDIYRYFAQGDHQTVSDYNCFYNAATSSVIAEFGTAYTLSAWSVYRGGDQHSIQSQPVFVNASGLLNTPSDFRLAGTSPGHGAASDGNDMGANIDSVGTKAGQATSAARFSPGNKSTLMRADALQRHVVTVMGRRMHILSDDRIFDFRGRELSFTHAVNGVVVLDKAGFHAR